MASPADTLDEVVKERAFELPILSKNDLLLLPDKSRRVRDIVQANGGKFEHIEIGGNWGHLDGVVNVTQAGDAIRGYLAK